MPLPWVNLLGKLKELYAELKPMDADKTITIVIDPEKHTEVKLKLRRGGESNGS